MGTNVVLDGSDLERKSWMVEGLIQKASESMFAPYTGTTKDAIVYQENDISAKAGHTVVFDYDGNLSGKAIKGKEQAEGKGEQKKKFSDKITVERYRFVVDNGDSFDSVNIGDLGTDEHSNSRSGLADLFIRWKDQGLIDSAQGNLGQAPTHIIDLGTTFTVNDLTDITTVLKTGKGFDTGATRRPPPVFKTESGQKMWLFVVDAAMAGILKKDSTYQSLVYNGDVRGNGNRAITGIIGKLGNLLIVEWDTFFGETAGVAAGASWGLGDTSIELAGLRQYDSVNTAWTGQDDFDETSTLRSRGLIFGAGALQLAMGKMPDYNMESFDHGIRTESLLETWSEVKKAKLVNESGGDYNSAKVAGVDWSVIAVDVTVQA